MVKETTVGQRFSQLIRALGMSKNAFALSLDKTATVVQHIVEERNKPGFDLLCKVFEVYPNVSKDWLLQGNGQMFPNGKTINANENDESEFKPSAVVASQLTVPTVARPRVKGAEAPAAEETVAAEPKAHVPAATAVADAVDNAPAVAEPHSKAEAASQTSAQPFAPVAPQGWEAALYAQQIQHQLALAEMRNQHLLEQQKMLQQMVELLRQSR